MGVIVDGRVANDSHLLESLITPSSSIEIFKLRERVVSVHFQEEVHEYRVCDTITVQQIIAQIIVFQL